MSQGLKTYVDGEVKNADGKTITKVVDGVVILL